MGTRYLAGERQTESGALNAAAQGVMRAIELFEDFIFTTLRNAQSPVQDADFCSGIRRRLPLKPNFNLLFAAGILFGIRQQIDDDLGQRIAVTLNENRAV